MYILPKGCQRKGEVLISILDMLINLPLVIDALYIIMNLTLASFVFFALGSKSTAMVMAGWSVHLTTLFPGQA